MSRGAAATSCGALLRELQNLWDEIGEDDHERDRAIMEIEKDCLNVYEKKVERTRKHKNDLHQALAGSEASISNLISSLGERESYSRMEKPKGQTLKEQLASLKPLLDNLRKKKEERVLAFMDIQVQIAHLCAEFDGTIDGCKSHSPQVDERDLTLDRLETFRVQLRELQNKKSLRLQKVNSEVTVVHELCTVMSTDISRVLLEVHPSLANSENNLKSVSDKTLLKLERTVQELKQEKKRRLLKLQDLGTTLIELWNLMDTPSDERKRFDGVTALISFSNESTFGDGSLALETIEQVELEVERLNKFKATKLKDIILKRQTELEEIYKDVHMKLAAEYERQMLIRVIDSGRMDLSALLLEVEDRISTAKDQALSRKDILERVEKWKTASEEESWLDEYEQDQNRYSAGRGVHKNLKRAEKARILVGKIPSLVEALAAKIKAWEAEKGIPFMYDEVKLSDTLDQFSMQRQRKEDEKKRMREQKKQQEQLAVEQEAMFGSAKPTPMRQHSAKKPLGQSSNANVMGTPGRRFSASASRDRPSAAGKERKAAPPIPVNYVALSKDSPGLSTP